MAGNSGLKLVKPVLIGLYEPSDSGHTHSGHLHFVYDLILYGLPSPLGPALYGSWTH